MFLCLLESLAQGKVSLEGQLHSHSPLLLFPGHNLLSMPIDVTPSFTLRQHYTL